MEKLILLIILLCCFSACSDGPTEANHELHVSVKEFQERYPSRESQALYIFHSLTEGAFIDAPHKLLTNEPEVRFLFGSPETGPVELRFVEDDVDPYDLVSLAAVSPEKMTEFTLGEFATGQVFNVRDTDWPTARIIYNDRTFLVFVRRVISEHRWFFYSEGFDSESGISDYETLYEHFEKEQKPQPVQGFFSY